MKFREKLRAKEQKACREDRGVDLCPRNHFVPVENEATRQHGEMKDLALRGFPHREFVTAGLIVG